MNIFRCESNLYLTLNELEKNANAKGVSANGVKLRKFLAGNGLQSRSVFSWEMAKRP